MRFVYSLFCLLLVAAAPLRAENLQPNQVVQNLVDDLAKTMETRRDELSKNREARVSRNLHKCSPGAAIREKVQRNLRPCRFVVGGSSAFTRRPGSAVRDRL